MKILIAIAAASLAVPAAAQNDPAPRAPTITAPAQGGGGATKAKPTRYCVKSDITGSRIQRRACRTRSDWLLQGYDPLDDLKK